MIHSITGLVLLPPVRVITSEYSQPAPTATATSTIMSRVRARKARQAPSKKIQHE